MKILLIDDHALFRSGIKSLLERRKIQTVEAGSAKQGIECLKDDHFEIILLDFRMPEMNGLQVLEWIRMNDISTPVIMLTTSSDEQDLADCLRAGAQGYLLKDMDPDDLVRSVKQVISGEVVVASDLTNVLARIVQQGENKSTKPQSSITDCLTPRELEVLKGITKGWSNKVIARNLGITDGTVKLHVKAILRKLNVHSRVEAAVIVVEEGL